eukprot:5518946-Ditylum_brightwellii.AAC.1
MDLPSDIQRTLMIIIDKNKRKSAPNSPQTPIASSSAQLNAKKRPSPATPYQDFFTPKQFKTNHRYLSPAALFSPYHTCDDQTDQLQSEINQLKEENEHLSQELRRSQSNEARVCFQLQEVQAKHRSVVLKTESTLLDQISDLRSNHSAEVTALQQNIDELLSERQQNKTHKEEILQLRDKLELSRQSNRKLSATEDQYQKCRNKLNNLLDVEQELKREEEAHAKCIEQCFAYKNELKSLRQIKQQAEEYKSNFANAEVRLMEIECELRKSKKQTMHQREEIKGLEEANSAMKQNMEESLEEEGIHERVLEERKELETELRGELLRLQHQ